MQRRKIDCLFSQSYQLLWKTLKEAVDEVCVCRVDQRHGNSRSEKVCKSSEQSFRWSRLPACVPLFHCLNEVSNKSARIHTTSSSVESSDFAHWMTGAGRTTWVQYLRSSTVCPSLPRLFALFSNITTCGVRACSSAGVRRTAVDIVISALHILHHLVIIVIWTVVVSR